MTPEPMPCSRRSSPPCGPKNGNGEALILVTFVIEMLTTEGNTRSVMSAIDSLPTCKDGFGMTVTGVVAPLVSAAISGCRVLADFAQPAAATVARTSKGVVNRRVIITKLSSGLADASKRVRVWDEP